MTVLHIWDADYPWDVRVEKINDALVAAGHRVHLVCRNTARRPPVEEHRGITIHRLPALRPVWGRLNHLVGFPLFCSPVWRRHALATGRTVGADLVLVRDLPLAPLGVFVARRLRVPVVMDMAENYPLMLQAMRDHNPFRPLDWLVRNPALAFRVERWVLPRLAGVITVIEEARERLVGLGVPPERLTVVRNTPPLGLYPADDPGPRPGEPPFNTPGSGPILYYNGLTNPSRGVVDFVRQMPALREEFPGVSLVIAGRGKDDERIRQAVRDLGLADRVFHRGWVSAERKIEYMRHCDVGLIPYRVTAHWNTTIPNKLFDYMAAAKPTLSTPVAPTARIIRETGAGLVYEAGRVEDMRRQLGILAAPDVRRAMGDAGRRAVEERYHWGLDQAVLLAGLERMWARSSQS